MKREELMVAAIKNGTVIDHIPSSRLFEVVNLLELEKITGSSVVMGYNLNSYKHNNKSIIKISDKFFSDAQLNQLSVIAPNVTLCIIKNYEVVEKKKVSLPKEIKGIVKCSNPKCITNNEPMDTLFTPVVGDRGTIKCHYCEKEQSLDNVKLVD